MNAYIGNGIISAILCAAAQDKTSMLVLGLIAGGFGWLGIAKERRQEREREELEEEQ